MTEYEKHICNGCGNFDKYGCCKKSGYTIRSNIGITVYEQFIERCGCASDTRSRPAPSPEEDDALTAAYMKGKAEAAAQAREDFTQVALDLLDYMPHAKNDGELETTVYVHDVRQMLKSLGGIPTQHTGGERR